MMGVKTSDVNLFEDITIQMRDTYEKKNADYGNSFEMQYNEYGLISSCIRIEDKLRRLKSLSKQEEFKTNYLPKLDAYKLIKNRRN